MDTVRWIFAGLGGVILLAAIGYVLGVKLDRKIRRWRERR